MSFKKNISIIAIVLIAMFGVVFQTLAFIGPSAGQTPGSGGGLFYTDSNRNIGLARIVQRR